jgi:predicted Zn-dependent protease
VQAILLVVASVAGHGQGPASPRGAGSQRFQQLAAKAAEARDAERLTEAQSLYQQALAIQPSWTEGWWSLGTILYESNNYRAAAPAFSRLLALAPRNGTAHLMLALCQYQLGSDDSAIGNIHAAEKYGVQKEKGLDRVLHYHLAMLLLRKGRYESALDRLRILVDDGVQSSDLDLALGMGVLLMRPASLPVEGSLERQVVLRAGQAEGLALLKKHDEARKRYDSLAKEFPNFPNIHYAYGRFLLAVQDPDASAVEFQQEIKNQPNHTRARVQIAAIHYRVDSAAGIPYAEQVVKLEPHYPFGHYLLGLLCLDSGDISRSIPELETAARMVPQEPQFHFALGNAYARAGRKREAARARATFLRLGGQNQCSGELSIYSRQRPLNVDSTGPAPKRQDKKRP